jgi:hypothetical protein
MPQNSINPRGTAVKKLIVFALFASAGVAHATADCSETLTGVIMHSNGHVYFTTTGSCSGGWCELAWTGETLNKGYALLLAAQAQGKPVGMRWSALSSCSAQNSPFASPDFISLPQ